MLTAAAAVVVPSSITLGPCSCHNHNAEVSCSTSYRVSSSWIRSPLDSQRVCDIRSPFDPQRVSVSGHSSTSFRCKSPLFGPTQYFWLSNGQENSLSRVSVAADYSDPLPDSSNFMGNNGYHPLEELREQTRVCDAKLTDAEIARTTVEANNRGVLLFPSTTHCEPHEQVSWADFQYVIDLSGDIAFEISDEENILLDYEPVDPVNVLIGMDISHYENRKMDDDVMSEDDFVEEMFMPDDFSELEDSEISHMQVNWGKANSLGEAHPVHFAKCLTKAIDSDHSKMMDHPPNGVSLWGYLIPVYGAEELYFRRLFDEEYTYGFTSDCRDLDNFSFSSSGCRRFGRSTIYRLEIIRIELLSAYGVQSTINKENFRDAQPDVLVHSMPDIIRRFNEQGIRYSFALRAFCKKKGLYVERAELIGVDSLGIDVRVFLGSEVETHRFPFKVRVTSEVAADKQIQQLIFPKSIRRRLRSHLNDLF